MSFLKRTDVLKKKIIESFCLLKRATVTATQALFLSPYIPPFVVYLWKLAPEKACVSI